MHVFQVQDAAMGHIDFARPSRGVPDWHCGRLNRCFARLSQLLVRRPGLLAVFHQVGGHARTSFDGIGPNLLRSGFGSCG